MPRQAHPKFVAAHLSEVSRATCRAYVAAHTKGGGRRDLEDLRAAINHHAKRELHLGLACRPTRRRGVRSVELPKNGKPRAKYLTRDEVAWLLWVCWRDKREQKPPRGPRKGQRVASEKFYDLRHVARFILMGIYISFAAAGRAVIDLDAGLYHRLPTDLDKATNKRSPTTRLGDRIASHIRRWRDRKMIAQYIKGWQGRPVASIKTAWKQAVKLAKIDGNPTPHTLRHTCDTCLKRAGLSSFDVAGFVGMSERWWTKVYGKHDRNYQRTVANAFATRQGINQRVGPSIGRVVSGTLISCNHW